MIIDFLFQIVQLLSNLASFVVKLVKDLVMVVQLLSRALLNLPLVLGFLPSVITPIVLAIFSVVIIYKVTARD